MNKLLGCVAVIITLMLTTFSLAQHSTPEKKVIYPDVIYFGATWCGPCRTAKPIVQRLEKDYNIILIDIDEQKEITRLHGITSIPAIFILKDGMVVRRFVGTADESILRGALKRR